MARPRQTGNRSRTEDVSNLLTVKPRKFDEDTEDFEEWLDHFNAVASVNRWSEEDQCAILKAYLPPRTLTLFKELRPEIRATTDFFILSTALCNKVTPPEKLEVYKSEFKVRTKKPSENLDEFGRSLRKLARKAYPNLNDQVRDELAKDQFILMLPSSQLRIAVRQGRPETLDVAIRLAIEMESYREVEKANVIRNIEEQNVNQVSTTPTLAEMMKQNQDVLKELINSMQRFQSVRRGEKRPLKCWKCGVIGHIKRNCPKNDENLE